MTIRQSHPVPPGPGPGAISRARRGRFRSRRGLHCAAGALSGHQPSDRRQSKPAHTAPTDTGLHRGYDVFWHDCSGCGGKIKWTQLWWGQGIKTWRDRQGERRRQRLHRRLQPGHLRGELGVLSGQRGDRCLVGQHYASDYACGREPKGDQRTRGEEPRCHPSLRAGGWTSP